MAIFPSINYYKDPPFALLLHQKLQKLIPRLENVVPHSSGRGRDTMRNIMGQFQFTNVSREIFCTASNLQQ